MNQELIFACLALPIMVFVIVACDVGWRSASLAVAFICGSIAGLGFAVWGLWRIAGFLAGAMV